jgi:hypothetical protein
LITSWESWRLRVAAMVIEGSEELKDLGDGMAEALAGVVKGWVEGVLGDAPGRARARPFTGTSDRAILAP